MSSLRSRALLAALAAAGCAGSTTGGARLSSVPAAAPAGAAPAATRDNPLLSASPLQYQAPRWDLIRTEHFKPAILAGMTQQLAEVAKIAGDPQPPTFDNTIVAMERSGALLTRATKLFGALTGANTNDTLQAVQEEVAPLLAAHYDAIYLNQPLFARVQALWGRHDALGLNPEQAYLLERYHTDFLRAGAQLAEADRTRLQALNKEESSLTASFRTKLLAATKAGAVVVDDRAQLAGLDEAAIAQAAQAAKERGLAGKFVLPLQNTTQQPVLASLKDRALRERVFRASAARGESGDSNDTRALVARLAQLRAEKAKLLGYPTFAAYAMATQSARNPEAAAALVSRVAAASAARAKQEAARLQAVIDREKGGFRLAPWDWEYYAEQVRRADYDLDQAEVKPYLALDRVLQDGVFHAANRMYGLTFKERHDLPVYHPDVRVFEVFDEDGSSLALFYADYFKRDNKGGGAWMDTFVDQSGLLGTKPVVYNVLNIPKPAAGQPALVTFDEASTMFHEFGHALHGIFSHVQYPTFSGANTPRDFVEFPSQFNEHWALEPSLFAHYARHYRTGAPMPQPLVDKIRRAASFNQGFATTETLAASLLDLAWHTQPAGAPVPDVDAFEQAALQRVGLALPEVPPRYRTPYFAHIWGGGYAAGYYAYLWSDVLAEDAHDWFVQHGGITRENGQRFRDMILSRGGTAEASALYRAWRGGDPSPDALLRARGLVPAAGAQ